MAWQFDSDRPIYAQLVEQIQRLILSGAYPPGSKLPSVRELAAQAAVNPNTMQKALAELETDGLLFTSAQRAALSQRMVRPSSSFGGSCAKASWKTSSKA